MITYFIKEILEDGVWTSPICEDQFIRHASQAVIAGYMGRPRWAETTEGSFIYGIDIKYKIMTSLPKGFDKPATYET